jgi:hypothetical protein
MAPHTLFFSVGSFTWVSLLRSELVGWWYTFTPCLPCILDSEDYEGKIRELLSDERTYEKLKKDPTTSVKNKLINLLKSWKQQNSIHHCLYQKLYPTSECPPKLYGLPKIHKINAPLRPIVSSWISTKNKLRTCQCNTKNIKHGGSNSSFYDLQGS